MAAWLDYDLGPMECSAGSGSVAFRLKPEANRHLRGEIAEFRLQIADCNWVLRVKLQSDPEICNLNSQSRAAIVVDK
jgi:hypothetical protein